MKENQKKSLEIIKNFIGKKVEAKLDGSMFMHVPDTFNFEFADPSELWEYLVDEYSDELSEWDADNIVPVASVSSSGSTDYKFAWLFLDWTNESEPDLVIATSDSWDSNNKVGTLDDLNLVIKK